MSKEDYKKLKKGGILDAGTSKNFKTGSWKMMKPEINHAKCEKSQVCVCFCPENAIHLNKETNQMEIDMDYCKGCGICANQCPLHAIIMKRI